MKKVFKALAVIAAAFVLCMGMAGCGSSYREDLSPEDVYTKISEGIQTEELNRMRSSAVPDQYGSDLAFADDVVVYKCASQAAPDEIAVFKLKKDADPADAEAIMQKRIDYQKEAFSDYQPQEMYKFDHTFVKTYGLYTIMIIADDTSAADSLIEGILAK